MQAWKGWTATAASAVTAAPTWNDWRVLQRRLLRSPESQTESKEENSPFSDRELARLSFARWLYQRGRLRSSAA